MSHPQQQQPHYRGGGGGRGGGGRQPGGRGQPQLVPGQQPQGSYAPSSFAGRGGGGPPPGPWAYQQRPQYQPMPPQFGYNPYGYYMPQQPPQPHLQGAPNGGAPPRYGGPPESGAQMPAVAAGRGVFYPPNNLPAPSTGNPAPAPRPRKPLVITDKLGNPLHFDGPKKAAAPAPAASTTAAAPAAPATAPTLSSEEAGEKLRQAVLERLEKDQAEKKEPTAPETKPLAPKPASTNGVSVSTSPEAETPEPKAIETEAHESTAPEPTITSDPIAQKLKDTKPNVEEVKTTSENTAPLPTEEAKTAPVETSKPQPTDTRPQEEGSRPQPPVKKKSLAALVKEAADKPVAEKKRPLGVYSKADLLSLKESPPCLVRPADLPEMEIIRREESRNDQGNRRGDNRRGDRRGSQKDGDQWARGNAPPRRQNSQSGGGGGGNNNGGSEWSRGQAPPRQQSKGRRSGRGYHQQPPLFDGPVAPLVKSENHWKPKKNVSAFVVAEKKVKSILNKMTKEKFDRLSTQMLEIPILSYDTLTMMIDNVYDKAIDEPSFGDMYADLCVRLSQSVQGTKFVHVIESDEEPPTDDGQTPSPESNDSSSHVVFRWSNDVSTSDSEVIGPLPSAEACIEAALTDSDASPQERGEMKLELVSVSIRHGRFIKIMKKQEMEEGETASFYVVFFPVAEAQDCGQQLSEIFLSEVECQADASKKNSFKRSLLNKCEEEFIKRDIYVDWKKEKDEYEASKGSMSDAEQAEKEEELNFRRIRIKKQMLGNVKFIGQLYKKGLIKEKIMRFCIASTLKLEKRDDVESKNPEYNIGDYSDMDEEDHEAICSMFSTIGTTIDKLPAANFMEVCFTKIMELSKSKDLQARSKFMYKDLIDLRSNSWIPRRKEEKAKTIAEIRKDVEREEQAQANSSRGGRGGGGDYRSGPRGNRGMTASGSSMRSRAAKPVAKTDDDGFTQIVSGRTAAAPARNNRLQPRQEARDSISSPKKSAFAALADDGNKYENDVKTPTEPEIPELSEDQLKRKVKSMRNDFMNDGGNVDELMLTWKEMSGTTGAGAEVVSNNVDHMMEAKEVERLAIYKILTLLCENGKLTKTDVQDGLADPIEFVDSAVMDCPRAFEYFGDVLGDMLRMQMLTIPWLCEQYQKILDADDQSRAPASITRHFFRRLKESGQSDAARSFLTDPKLKDLLGSDVLDEMLG